MQGYDFLGKISLIRLKTFKKMDEILLECSNKVPKFRTWSCVPLHSGLYEQFLFGGVH